MKYCSALLFIIVTTIPAHAISVSGEANTLCREFTYAPPPRQVQLIFWVNGFISARNVYSIHKDAPALNDRAVAVELWDYCKKAPDAWLINASIFVASKLAHEPSPGFVMGPGTPAQ